MSKCERLVHSDNPKQVLDQIRQFSGISQPDDERIREIILDLHTLLEKNLNEILYRQLKGLVLCDDREDELHQELRDRISKLSFSAILDLLSPILISWYDNRPFLTMEQEDKYRKLVESGKTKDAERYKNSYGLKSDIVKDLRDINAIRNKAAHDPENCSIIKNWRQDKDIDIVNSFAWKCVCNNMDLIKIIEDGI